MEAGRRHVWLTCWSRFQRACRRLAGWMFRQLWSSWISQVVVKIFHLKPNMHTYALHPNTANEDHTSLTMLDHARMFAWNVFPGTVEACIHWSVSSYRLAQQ